MRALSQLVEHRRRLVGDRVRITNRLTSTLKTYFPQVLQWLPNKETKLFCDFLSQWPTLKAAQLARRSTLERFFRQHHVRGEQRINERLEAIKSAMALTTDEGIIMPHALLVNRSSRSCGPPWKRLRVSTKRLPSELSIIPILLSSRRCQERARRWLHACWWRLGNSGSAMAQPLRCKPMPVLPR